MRVSGIYAVAAVVMFFLSLAGAVAFSDTTGNKTVAVKSIYFPGDEVVVKANFKPSSSTIIDPSGKAHSLKFKEKDGTFVAEFGLKKNVVLGKYLVMVDNITTEFFVDSYSISASYSNGKIAGNVSYYFVQPNYVEYEIDGEKGRANLSGGSFVIPVGVGKYEVLLICGNAEKKLKISPKLEILAEVEEINDTAVVSGKVLIDGQPAAANLSYWFEGSKVERINVNGSFNLTFNVSGGLHLRAEVGNGNGNLSAEKVVKIKIKPKKKIVEVGEVYFPGETVLIKANFKPEKGIVVSGNVTHELEFEERDGWFISEFELKKDVVLGNYTVIVDGIVRHFVVDFCEINASVEDNAIVGSANCYITAPEVRYVIEGKEKQEGSVKVLNGSFEIPLPEKAGNYTAFLECGNAKLSLNFSVKEGNVSAGRVYFVNDTAEVFANFKPEKGYIITPSNETVELNFSEYDGRFRAEYRVSEVGRYNVRVDEFNLSFVVDDYSINASFNGSAVVGNVSWHFVEPSFVEYIIYPGGEEGKAEIKNGGFTIKTPENATGILLECGNARLNLPLLNETALPNASIILNPENGTAGIAVVVNGKGFQPNATVEIYFDDTPVNKTVADENGSFTATFKVPNFPPGKYEVTANSIAYASFEVLPVKIKNESHEIIAFDPVKKVIVVQKLKEKEPESELKVGIKSLSKAKSKVKKIGNTEFSIVEVKADRETLKSFNFSTDVLNTKISSKKLKDDLIRVEVTNKTETWYRFSVEIPKGYGVKEIVGDDGRRIVNTLHVNRTTGEIEGVLRWYIDNGTLYFYDDPIWGYNISLTPPAPNRSIAIELAYNGAYSGAGQISAIVFPYSQGDNATTIATYDHAGRTEDNGYGNDIDIDAGSKIALRFNVGGNTRQYGNEYYYRYHECNLWWRGRCIWWSSTPNYIYATLGADGNLTQANRADVPLNTVPDGTLESVIITNMQTERREANITQKVIIRDNYRWFATIYYIKPNRDLTNLRFFQGMDWNFAGSYDGDNAYYNTTYDIVYGYDSNAPPGDIQYGGYGSNLRSSAHDVNYYTDIYLEQRPQATLYTRGMWGDIYRDDLNNNTEYIGDAATALAWDIPSLSAGETWVVPIIWGLGYDFNDMVNQILEGKSKLFDAGIKSIDAPANNSKFNPSTAGIVYFNATAALYGLVDAENLEVIFNVTRVGGGYSYQNSTFVSLYVPHNETATVSFPLNLSSLPYGKYKAEFKTNLPNDQNTTNDAKWIYFYISAFTVEPNQQKTGNPGEEIKYTLTSANYFAAGRFDINITQSTKGWATRVYNGTTLVAEDSNGDGVWDTVNEDSNGNGIPDIFLPYGLSYINISKIIPPTAPLGETDTTTLKFSSIASPDIYDDVTVFTSTPSPPTKQKQFYLHSDFTMNTSRPASGTSGVTAVKASTIESWYQSPPFASTFKIYDRIFVNLWMNSSAAATNQISVSVIKTDGVNSEVVGVNSSQLSMTTSPNLFTVTIPLTSPVTFNRGEYAVLRIDNPSTNDIFVFHSLTYPSNITFNTTTYIKVADLYTSECLAGEPIRIYANVTDPIGSYDISSANVQIYFENNTLAESGSMSLNTTDTSSPSLWKLFDYSTSLQQGNYTVNVTAVESNGVVYTGSVPITCSVPITTRNITATLSILGDKLRLKIYSMENVSSISLYWIKPANISISATGNFDSNGTTGNIYWWNFDSINAGETKYVNITLQPAGVYSMIQAFNIGIDPD